MIKTQKKAIFHHQEVLLEALEVIPEIQVEALLDEIPEVRVEVQGEEVLEIRGMEEGPDEVQQGEEILEIRGMGIRGMEIRGMEVTIPEEIPEITESATLDDA